MNIKTDYINTAAYTFTDIKVTDAPNGQSGKIELTVIACDGTPVPGVNVLWEISQDEEQSDTTISVSQSITDITGMAFVDVKKQSDGFSSITASINSVIKNIKVMTYTLDAPIVTNTEGGKLDVFDLMSTIQVMIPSYSNVTFRDKITLHWATAEGVDIRTSTRFIVDANNDMPIIINVKFELPPECLAQQNYGIYYESSDVLRNTSFSQRLFFFVDRQIPLATNHECFNI